MTQELRPLQGDVVPFLAGVGQLPSGHMFVATSLIRGVSLADLPGAGIKSSVRTAARAAVARLHAMGVVHGDLTLENMLWVRNRSAKPTAAAAGSVGATIASGDEDQQQQQQQQQTTLRDTKTAGRLQGEAAGCALQRDDLHRSDSLGQQSLLCPLPLSQGRFGKVTDHGFMGQMV